MSVTESFFVCQSVSLSNTLLDHSWHVFFILIHDYHRELSVRFKFVRDLNPYRKNYVDPCSTMNRVNLFSHCVLYSGVGLSIEYSIPQYTLYTKTKSLLI